MRTTLFTAAALVCFAVLSAFTFNEAGGNKFTGVSTCKACHNTDKTGKQYAIWEKTKHAEAYKALQTPKADEVAAKRGSKVKAVETPECLGCHVTGMSMKDAQYDTKFAKDEGVGCETCHGAGSAYKALHMKKENLDKAIAAGMQIPKASDGAAEKLCKSCHNEKSPTFKGFKFEEKWKLIEHPLPKS